MDKDKQRELFEEIKSKNDIAAVISEYVSLKRAGRALVGLCPFHGEKTPSFNVNTGRQFFYCFGCNAGGDVFSFIMKIENLDFVGAARHLANRAGIPWPEVKFNSELDRQKEELYKINKLAMTFYHQCLHKTTSGEKARKYLINRGLSLETCQKFNLGYAPPNWHTLTEILRKKGVSLEKAESLGLVGYGENGYYDRFRDRVIFPIADPKGNIIGFGGRVYNATSAKSNGVPQTEQVSQPKYLNSPETPIFHKGHFLYGLSLAKESIRNKDQAIIVEGYLDVIQAHQAGFLQVVASLGTALTKEQAKMIKKYTTEVILAYDADSAGQHATIRGMDILEEAGLKVKILNLPEGDDPDSFIKANGAEKFNDHLEKALILTDFKISLALKQFDLRTPEGKNLAVQNVLPVISSIESNVSREDYIRRLSREIGVSETSLFAELQEWHKNNRKKSPVLDRNLNNSYTKGTNEKIGIAIGGVKTNELSPFERTIFKAEKELLQSILQEYDKFKRIKEELMIGELSFEIWRDLFTEIKLIESSMNTSGFDLDALSAPLREVAVSLIAEQEIKDVHNNLEGCLNRLEMLHLQERIQNLAGEITTGRDLAGRILSESELKEKITVFTELKRKFPKEFPHFSAGI